MRVMTWSIRIGGLFTAATFVTRRGKVLVVDGDIRLSEEATTKPPARPDSVRAAEFRGIEPQAVRGEDEPTVGNRAAARAQRPAARSA
jgi:hypothetical protein